MEPGWYPDPFARVGMRWWDGRGWTSYASAAAAPAMLTPTEGSPRDDLAGELGVARWAKVALLVAAAISVVAQWIAGLDYPDILRTEADRASRGEPPPPTTGAEIFLDFSGFLVLLVLLVFMTWLYRAARLARRAGLPARRSAGWAFGAWFVPVVNLWFPYQLAADAIPRTDPDRRWTGWWWTAYLSASLFLLVTVGVGFAGTLAAGIAAAVGTALNVVQVALAWRMIDAVAHAHRGIVGVLVQTDHGHPGGAG